MLKPPRNNYNVVMTFKSVGYLHHWKSGVREEGGPKGRGRGVEGEGRGEDIKGADVYICIYRLMKSLSAKRKIYLFFVLDSTGFTLLRVASTVVLVVYHFYSSWLYSLTQWVVFVNLYIVICPRNLAEH